MGCSKGHNICLFQMMSFAKSGMELTTRVRKATFAAILKQEMAFFDQKRNSTTALCGKLASDTMKIQGSTGIRLGTIVKSVSTVG